MDNKERKMFRANMRDVRTRQSRTQGLQVKPGTFNCHSAKEIATSQRTNERIGQSLRSKRVPITLAPMPWDKQNA